MGTIKKMAKWVRDTWTYVVHNEPEWVEVWEWESDEERAAFIKWFRFSGWSKR